MSGAPETNPFELFSLQVRPWLETEQVQARFVEQAALWHPDTNTAPGAAAHFQKITAASKLLKDPVKRLEWVILHEPESENAAQSNGVPPALPDLFLEIATLQRQLSAFLAQQDSTKSPLSLALLRGEALALKSDLERLAQKTELLWRRCEIQVRAADSVWERRNANTLRSLREVLREMVYLQRWRTQLREALIQIQTSTS
jgi:curved DNA-binding protein CbpA